MYLRYDDEVDNNVTDQANERPQPLPADPKFAHDKTNREPFQLVAINFNRETDFS